MPCGELSSFKGKLADLNTLAGLDPSHWRSIGGAMTDSWRVSRHAGGFIRGAHLAGFQATLADLVSYWQEVGEFSSTLAGLSKN